MNVEQAPESKRRRVPKACAPCKKAHSACDRKRPCKRCLALERPEDCVDLVSNRRRGRPRRALLELEQLGSHPKLDGEAHAEDKMEQSSNTQQQLDGGLVAQLLEEFRRLSNEMSGLKKEIQEIQRTQNIQQKQLSIVLPLVSSLTQGPSHLQPPSPLRTFPITSEPGSVFSSSLEVPARKSLQLDSVVQMTHAEKYGQQTYGQAMPPGAGPAVPETPVPLSYTHTISPSISSPFLSTPLSTASDTQPSLGQSSFISSPHSTAPNNNSHLPLATYLSSSVHDYTPHPPLQQNTTESPHNPFPNFATNDKAETFQQGAAKIHAYSHNGLDATLATRKTMAARNTMAAHLPFLHTYNITSLDVPFVASDPMKPIIACNIHERSKPEEMVESEIVFANPAFCSLIFYHTEEVVGCNVFRFISFDSGEPVNDCHGGVLTCLTMRSRVTVSPIFHQHAFTKRKDGVTLCLNLRMQIFYDERGFPLWHLIVVQKFQPNPLGS